MSPRKKKEDNSGVTPLDQINSYLEQNKGDHYNFEEERVYTVSSEKPLALYRLQETFKRWTTLWLFTLNPKGVYLKI